MQTTSELIRQRNTERYEQYRLFEEKTDIGERLSLPIENHLELEVADGAVYGRDVEGNLRRMTEWSDEAYRSVLNDESYCGVNAVERTRRMHEYEEAVAVEELGQGEAMIVFSPIPDAALAGQLSIQGYRTDLARTFCRLYYREADAVAAITISLEQSNKAALRRAAEAVGMTLPTSMQSEEILATRYVAPFSEPDFAQLPDVIRASYDLSLFEQTGTSYFAGNRLAGRQDSMQFINANHDIIEEHMAFLRSVESRMTPGSLRDAELESLRRRTAAALDERLHGGTVASIGDTTVSDRLMTNDYGGECATGVQGAQEQMGLAQGKHVTNCPLCGAKGVTATVEGERITCSDCAGSVDICTGKVTVGKPRPPRTKRQQESQPIRKQAPLAAVEREGQMTARYGEKVTIKRVKTIGGEDKLVLNARGEVLDKLR